MKKRFLICCVCLVCLLTMSAFAVEAPVIMTQPQNVYFPAGQEFPASASFTILATGDDLSYQWQVKDGDANWRDASLSTATTNTLTITNVQENQVNGHRLFRCVVSNTEGTAVSSAVSIQVGFFVMDSLPQLLSWTSEAATSIFDWVGLACAKIVSEPLLLFTCGFLAIGGCIALVGRLLSRS